jgi:hypothetical protein
MEIPGARGLDAELSGEARRGATRRRRASRFASSQSDRHQQRCDEVHIAVGKWFDKLLGDG